MATTTTKTQTKREQTLSKTTNRLSESEVRERVSGRRFHQLTNPNPKTAADVTSTWTIPSAGKDELVFKDDGTCVFNGEVHFVEGHVLTRCAGYGASWSLHKAPVPEGDWIALRLSQVYGGAPEDFVGESMWRVAVTGPELLQEGQAMELDDVNECGVITEFEAAKVTQKARNNNKEREPAPEPGASSVKRIKRMVWWVDDLLASWKQQLWLTPEEQRQREARRKNPTFTGLGKGFLKNRKTETQATSQRTDTLEFMPFDRTATQPVPTATTKQPVSRATTSLQTTQRLKKERLPPLVPRRADLASAAPKKEKPPHTYFGVRIEDLTVLLMVVLGGLLVAWEYSRLR